MNLFFEESGDFKAGAVLSQQGEAYQVELPTASAPRSSARDVLLQFADAGAGRACWTAAHQVADDVDLDFLWEVAGQEEFGFAELGAEYFGHAPLPHEAAGLVLALHSAPIYFHQQGPRPLQGRAGVGAEGGAGRHRKEAAAGAGAGRLCRGTESRPPAGRDEAA